MGRRKVSGRVGAACREGRLGSARRYVQAWVGSSGWGRAEPARIGASSRGGLTWGRQVCRGAGMSVQASVVSWPGMPTIQYLWWQLGGEDKCQPMQS